MYSPANYDCMGHVRRQHGGRGGGGPHQLKLSLGRWETAWSCVCVGGSLPANYHWVFRKLIWAEGWYSPIITRS